MIYKTALISLPLVISICLHTVQTRPWSLPNQSIPLRFVVQHQYDTTTTDTLEASTLGESSLATIVEENKGPTQLGMTTMAPRSSPSLCRGSCDRFQRIGLLKSTNEPSGNKKIDGEVDLDESMHGFDHQDFVVSNLEFELVLRRLQRECEDCKINSDNQEQASIPSDGIGKEQEARRCGEDVADSPECLECLDEETIKSILLFCGHKFNRKCLNSWHKTIHETTTVSRCPICNCRDTGQQSGQQLTTNDKLDVN